jgi:L-cystine uptake protein TcyP (sodium:dicarboxylate symporter family)
VPIVVLWKPYYLFTSGFKESVAIYWKGVIRNYIISLSTFAMATYILRSLPINPYSSIGNWMAYSAIGMIIFLFINTTATLLFAKGAIDSLNRIKSVIKK